MPSCAAFHRLPLQVVQRLVLFVLQIFALVGLQNLIAVYLVQLAQNLVQPGPVPDSKRIRLLLLPLHRSSSGFTQRATLDGSVQGVVVHARM